MKLLLMIIIEIMIFVFSFVLLRIYDKAFDRIAMKVFKCSPDPRESFDISYSIAILILFFITWFVCMYIFGELFTISNQEYYFAFGIIGFITVLWCYFSWDRKKVFKLVFARIKEKNYKRAIVYFFILFFVIAKGYHEAIENQNAIKLFHTFDYAVISGALAFDNFLNVIWSILIQKSKEKKIVKK